MVLVFNFSSILGNFLVIVQWQMESSQNENTISIENEMELNVNEMDIDQEEIVRTSKLSESFQIENIIVENNEPKECKQIFKSCIFKEKYREDITKMHYIEPLIVLMMGKMLKGEVFKSWDALFVMLILWIMLIQALKTKKV